MDVQQLSSEIPLKAVRSLEKARQATCLFADAVANAVVDRFRSIEIDDKEACESLRGGSQTCLAGIVMLRHNRLTVTSIGAGTKVLPEELAREDQGKCRVLDCHAEVLARRAFCKFLASEICRWKNSSPDTIFSAKGALGDDLPKLDEGVSFHLYCSSAPCGNACVRKWAKGSAEKCNSSIPDVECPKQTHPKFTSFSYAPLQTTVLCKVGHSLGAKRAREEEIPLGTTLPLTPEASGRATCSDKIARWVGLGLEGALLNSILNVGPRGVPLASVTVGRKFSRSHLERAICCRLGSFLQSDEHPSILCTSVKLQEGGREADAKAVFTDFAFAWADVPDLKPDVIRPSIGLVGDGAMSFVSKSNLLKSFLNARGPRENDSLEGLSYSEVKAHVTRDSYRIRKDLLLSKHLTPWPTGGFNQGFLRPIQETCE